MTSAAVRLFSLFGAAAVLILIIGFYCLVTTKNLIRALIALEVAMKAVTLLIIVSGYVVGRVALAQALAITLIIIEVAVIVVAVGVVLCVHRRHNSLDTALLRNIKG